MLGKFSRILFYRAGCLALLFVQLLSPVSGAASPAPGAEQNQQIEQQQQREELIRKNRQQAEERQQHQQQSDVFLQQQMKADTDESLPEEAIAFPIKNIQLTGERVKHFNWIQKMLKHYEGRRIGKESISVIVKRITKALVDRGYITTRIMVPEQELSNGTLRLVLIPGTIRQIAIDQHPELSSWKPAFPVSPGDILNLRDLEQGLEQMKRIPSQDVTLKLVPGNKAGESDVIITLKQKRPWKLILSVDDSGSKTTGRMQSMQTLSMDNLLGVNDLFSFSNNHDADFKEDMHGTQGYSFKYSVPQGYWTYSFSHSYYDYHQTVVGSSSNYVYSGDSDTSEFSIERLIDRNQTSKTTLQGKLIKKHSKSYLDDTEIEVQSKDTTAAELGVSRRKYYGKAVWDIDLDYRMGTPWFGAQAETDSGSSASTTRYHIWTLSSSFVKPIKIGHADARYTCNIRGQFTNDSLYTIDCFSIGNRYTVRGFDGEQTLTGENGWFIQNEVSMPLAVGSELYAGIDYGKVGGPKAGELLGTELAGAVFGIRGTLNQLSYDVFAGWPIYKPDGYETAPTTYGFQVTYQI